MKNNINHKEKWFIAGSVSLFYANHLIENGYKAIFISLELE